MTLDTLISLLAQNKDISESNITTIRNESFQRQVQESEAPTTSPGWRLFERAEKTIPGGNLLLSKRPDMFLPGKWPSYFSRSQGCYVWDIDGAKFTDMSIMGVGTNILGYCNPSVDSEVINALSRVI